MRKELSKERRAIISEKNFNHIKITLASPRKNKILVFW